MGPRAGPLPFQTPPHFLGCRTLTSSYTLVEDSMYVDLSLKVGRGNRPATLCSGSSCSDSGDRPWSACPGLACPSFSRFPCQPHHHQHT